jgi:menaquinone-dependent protoporphyrinogen oxidase
MDAPGRTFGPVERRVRCSTVEQEAIEMAILVAYASKHGATGEIAERIAESLREAGQDADVRPFQEAGDLNDYDGFVLGSAAYMGHWLKDATAFLGGNRDVLAKRPVWLFSSGPLGNEATDAKGVDLRTSAEPKELPEFQQSIHPRDHHVFFGVLDPGKLSFTERSLRRLPSAAAILPEGDFRNWDEIQDWAYGIALELAKLNVTDTNNERR